MLIRCAWLLITIAGASAVTFGCGGDAHRDENVDAGAGGVGGGAIGGTGGSATGGTSGSGGAAGGAGAAGSGGVITACSEPTSAVAVLHQGWWLCGWSGGLDHYSWMYFGPGDLSGTVTILDATCPACTSYFSCTGTDGRFDATASMRAVAVTMPSSCGATGHTIWEVTEICPPQGFPPGSSAYVTLTGGSDSLRCDRYPLDHCDASLSSCAIPY